MAKQTIQSLIASTAGTKGLPVKTRVGKEQYAKIERDLKLVVKHTQGGGAMPPKRKLREYIADKYGVVISENALRSWLIRLADNK